MTGLFKSAWAYVYAWALLAVVAQPITAALNNGFNSDYYFTLTQNNKTKVHDEDVRSGDPEVATYTDGTLGIHYLRSLTFAGKGSNDARLFGIAPNGTWTNWWVREYDATGAEAQPQKSLAELAGLPTETLWGEIDLTNIRYNAQGNGGAGSLVIPVMDGTVEEPLKVIEVDLSLNTLNIYQGPSILSAKLGCDVDPATGRIYVATGTEVVAFDTGVTGSYSTVVQASDLGATPYSVVFRDAIGGLTQKSLVVTQLNGEAREFDLSGNHLRSYEELVGPSLRYGQQDRVTGTIVFGSVGGQNHFFLESDNNVVQGMWGWTGNYLDAASPYHAGPFCPVIMPVASAEIPSETEYVRQLRLKPGTGMGTITWSMVQGPTGAQVDNTGLVHGWTPGANDVGSVVVFEVAATDVNCDPNPKTCTWTVKVTDGQLWCNGFRADWVYMCRKPGEGGNIRVFYETDDPLVVAVDDFQPDNTNWCSISFAGRGNNDCRLFGIRGEPLVPATATDIEIAEFDPAGNIIKQVKLGAIAPGYGANNLGPAVEPLNIRYSRFHNSLFISVNQDKSAASPALAMEVDLELTTVLNVYEGPDIVDGGVAIDMDRRDGTLYMTNRSLNGSAGKGDLIAFDTSQGSTSSYVTLIDGDTFTGGLWDAPGGIVYRHRLNNPSHRPTIVVLMTATTELQAVEEFYLDAKDGNDNLIRRGELISLRQAWGAQMDEASHTIWFAPADGGGSVNGVRRDDTVYQPDDPANWNKPWVDVDSPPATIPPCGSIVFADTDGDDDVDATDFGILQVCLAPQAGTIPDEPAACECLDHNGDHDVDDQDVLDFLACGTGPAVPYNPSDPPTGCDP